MSKSNDCSTLSVDEQKIATSTCHTKYTDCISDKKKTAEQQDACFEAMTTQEVVMPNNASPVVVDCFTCDPPESAKN